MTQRNLKAFYFTMCQSKSSFACSMRRRQIRSSPTWDPCLGKAARKPAGFSKHLSHRAKLQESSLQQLEHEAAP